MELSPLKVKLSEIGADRTSVLIIHKNGGKRKGNESGKPGEIEPGDLVDRHGN
jgi:hypothetical protein